jgi:LuxR family maltose regulon positive regulatory protein
VRAGLRLAAGDPAGCLELLEEAERVYDTDFSPAVRPIGARRARAYVRQGDLSAARAWARERNLSTDDELRYVNEFEHITLAIILVNDAPGQRALQQVGAMLDRLLAAAEAGGRGSSVIEILAVQALARDARGDTSGALDALRRAVELAEPEGYVRVFDYLGPRLHALREGLATGAVSTRPQQPGLVDPLSDRELDVLRLLRSELSGPDIARELMVSLNTMRTHTKNIYTKLGVNNRREAVRRAHELGL